MSAWGDQDNVAAVGTVTAYAGNSRVNGSSTAFTSNVKEGDYVFITGQKFQVATITSNTVLDLTSNGKAVSGATLYVQQGPKYIANVAVSENVYTIQRVYGIDRQEIGVANTAANASHTGWVHFYDYTDANGGYRRKSEVLVALSKNFASNSTFHVQVAGYDADDDTVAPDTV
jgi:hypothetical protein